jgi:hypothetical protein
MAKGPLTMHHQETKDQETEESNHTWIAPISSVARGVESIND